MPITSQLTSIEDFEGAPSFNGYGGGAGASTNTDILIEGLQSSGRRVDNVTAGGFGVVISPTVDLSGAGVHVKIWLFITQWRSVTQVQARLASGNNAVDDHNLPSNQFPLLGGFIPVWVDVSRTPEVGGTANEAAINEIGIAVSIGNVGGNAQNLIIDEIHHGTAGLLWDGTGGSITDFQTYESTNSEGNLIENLGVNFVYSRLQIGSATATTFTDSGLTLIFPDQTLVAETFMGITCDLQNASTSITLSNSTIQSANVISATRRPDFIATGTSGVLTLTAMNLLGLRTLTLTSACSVDSSFIESLSITQGNASISNTSIRTASTSNVSCFTDANLNNLSSVNFVQASAGYAFEITAAGTYSLTDFTYSGYDGVAGTVYTTSAGGEAIYVSATVGTVDLQVNGGDLPTVYTAGATVNIISAVGVTIRVKDIGTNEISNARVGVYRATDDLELFNGLTDVNGEASFNTTGGTDIYIRVRKSSVGDTPRYVPVETIGNTGTGLGLTVTLLEDTSIIA